jgi:membrane protease YdiL (CAAX protease family)
MTFSDPASPRPPGEADSPEPTNVPEMFLSPQNVENANVPEDIRVPWGWTELGLFLLFGVFSIFVIYLVASVYLLARFHMSREQLQNFLSTSAPFTIGFEVTWSLLLLGFLILMIRIYHGQRFWYSIGWRKLRKFGRPGTIALLCIAGGTGLALAVAIASPFVETNAHVPMQDLFESRANVLWLMCYGILFAPFWEETLFRGFTYPVIAREWGVPSGILVTGLLFGAMHAAQLWGGWGQIILLTFVGIVLTWVRARAGTVVASFLVHVTYNSILFGVFFVGTHGLHRLPPVH